MIALFKNKITGLSATAAVVGCTLLVGMMGWRMGKAAGVQGVSYARSGTTQREVKPAITPVPVTSAPPSPPAISDAPKPPAPQLPPAVASAPVAPPVEKAPVVDVDPTLPSNYLFAGDQFVAVQGYVPPEKGQGMALDMLVLPANAVTRIGDSPADSASPSGEPAPDAVANPPTLRGFSYEEQLFRSKWGWAAFGAAQRMAQWKQ